MIDVGKTHIPKGRYIYTWDDHLMSFSADDMRQNRHILTLSRSHEEEKDVPRVVNGTGSYGNGRDRSC
jgi:hypothetical protein